MKTIYLNAEFECSATQKQDTIEQVETEVFDGKCAAYIEGYRFVPNGKTWARKDGAVFAGEMITPYVDSTTLEKLQALYDEINIAQETQNSQISYIGMMTEVI